MAPRRLLVAGLVALVIAIGVRSGVSTQSATPAEPDVTSVDAEPNDNVLAPTTSPVETTSKTRATSASAVSSLVRSMVEAEPAPTLPPSELTDLVAASRPPMSAVEVVDDGAYHDAPDRSVATTAATVVVWAWTWRFDDTSGRLRDQLANIANDEVIGVLAPTTQEIEARSAAAEVSWAIVRTVTINGSDATVIFDHHLVTSTSAETVTSHTAVVTVVDGRAIGVNL